MNIALLAAMAASASTNSRLAVKKSPNPNPDPKPVTLYLVMRLSRWSKTQTESGQPLAEKMDNGSIGMVPVFETREEAERAAKGSEILTIQEHPAND